jgi:hypothetical protein
LFLPNTSYTVFTIVRSEKDTKKVFDIFKFTVLITAPLQLRFLEDEIDNLIFKEFKDYITNEKDYLWITTHAGLTEDVVVIDPIITKKTLNRRVDDLNYSYCLGPFVLKKINEYFYQ